MVTPREEDLFFKAPKNGSLDTFVLSYGGISIDQFLFLFLHSACDTRISSTVPLYCIMFY